MQKSIMYFWRPRTDVATNLPPWKRWNIRISMLKHFFASLPITCVQVRDVLMYVPIHINNNKTNPFADQFKRRWLAGCGWLTDEHDWLLLLYYYWSWRRTKVTITILARILHRQTDSVTTVIITRKRKKETSSRQKNQTDCADDEHWWIGRQFGIAITGKYVAVKIFFPKDESLTSTDDCNAINRHRYLLALNSNLALNSLCHAAMLHAVAAENVHYFIDEVSWFLVTRFGRKPQYKRVWFRSKHNIFSNNSESYEFLLPHSNCLQSKWTKTATNPLKMLSMF